MDIATFAISVAALLVACAAAWYARSQTVAARRQAVASEEAVRIERDRRAEEQADRTQAELAAATANVALEIADSFGLNSRPMVRVVNRGSHEAVDVLVYYLDANDGLDPPDTSRWHELGGEPLRAGAARSVPFDPSYETTRDFRAVLEWTDGRGGNPRDVRLRA